MCHDRLYPRPSNVLRSLVHEGDRPGSGRKRTANMPRNRKFIQNRVKRNPTVSMRKIALVTAINREAFRQLAKNELRLMSYKLQKVQRLTEDNKRVRLQKCRKLKRRFAAHRCESILFTDEKLFILQQAHNSRNDRVWSSNVPGTSAIVENRQKPQSVIVWGGVCVSGKTPLVFVEKRFKINQTSYQRDILETVVLPWTQQYFQNGFSTFQQDFSPAHKAKLTQEGCRTHFPNFIASTECPPTRRI